jgi:hypothetical protein
VSRSGWSLNRTIGLAADLLRSDVIGPGVSRVRSGVALVDFGGAEQLPPRETIACLHQVKDLKSRSPANRLRAEGASASLAEALA